MTIASRMRPRCLALFFTFAAGLAVAFCAHAQESTHTIRLKYRDDGYRAAIGLPYMMSGTFRFESMPDFGDHRVHEFPMNLTNDSKNCIGVAWDETANKLYVDINRDLDLKNDQALTPERVTSDGLYPLIEGLKLQVDGAVPRTYRVDLRLPPRGEVFNCQLRMRSGWEGETQIGGETWIMAIVDNLDGVIDENDRLLLYRKRDKEVDPALLWEVFGLRVRPQICIGDTLLKLNYRFEAAGDHAEIVVDRTEERLPSGEVEFAGQYLERVTLSGARNVILDTPKGIVRVPAGRYTVESAYVHDPASMLYLLAGVAPSRVAEAYGGSVVPLPLSVVQNGPVTLRVGAPLDNRVQVERDSCCVSGNYRLSGLGGETYTKVFPAWSRTDDRANPVLLLVKGGHGAACGSFEYG